MEVKCEYCDGEGSADSGGSEPWGQAIFIKCPKCGGSGKVPAPLDAAK